jgi:hypothetical protein
MHKTSGAYTQIIEILIKLFADNFLLTTFCLQGGLRLKSVSIKEDIAKRHKGQGGGCPGGGGGAPGGGDPVFVQKNRKFKNLFLKVPIFFLFK